VGPPALIELPPGELGVHGFSFEVVLRGIKEGSNILKQAE